MNEDFSHDYMEQCPYCKKYLLASQVEQHICNAPLLDVREIPILFNYETSNDSSDRIIIARGFDGVPYRLIKCKNPLADEKKQSNRTDGEVTEPFLMIALTCKMGDRIILGC